MSTTTVTDDPRTGDIIKEASSYEKGLFFRSKRFSLLSIPLLSFPFAETKDIYHKKVGIVGFPYDEGTGRNGGRLGGAKGPEYFRKVRCENLPSLCHPWPPPVRVSSHSTSRKLVPLSTPSLVLT
jgi:hypothetical protein